MIYAKVRDKKTNVERTVTPKAYSIIPHRYVLLGYQDEEGNPVNAPSNVDNIAVRTEKKRNLAVERVEDKSGLQEDAPKITREDLDRMNEEAMEKAKARIEAKKAAEAAIPVKKATPPKKKARA